MIPSHDEEVERAPLVTLALIGGSVAAFLWQVDVGAWPAALEAGQWQEFVADRLQETAFRGGVVPYEILTLSDVDLPDLVPPPLTILTSMVLHAGFLHLAFNLLFLWTFGRGVEGALGRPRLLLLYPAAGIVAALVQVVASATTGAIEVPVVGASGAIAGVLAASLVLLPRARPIRRVPLSARALVGAWFALQVLSVAFGGNAGVALFAHLGGFVAGLVLVRVLGTRPGWRGREAG